MHSSAKQVVLLAALLMGMLLNACENDLNKIKEISAQQNTNAVDSTTMVDVIYSDSAKVKLHMMAPLLLKHDDDKHPEKAYQEMPRGVKIVFYDTLRKESGNIIADFAILHIQSNIIEFHKNVVATNSVGDTYRSDELIWDQNKKIIYSNKPVQLNKATGDVLNGVSFTSDEKLNQPSFGHTTATFHVSDMPGN